MFPTYVHSIIHDSHPSHWPMVGQGLNECSFTSIANALNLMLGEQRYTKEEFIREAGLLFQPKLGGTLPPLKAWQLRRRGYGTHFGRLSNTNGEAVLRDLVDRGVPVIVDIYPSLQFGRFRIYGAHATLLVGYSQPFTDASGKTREEYYLVDPQWPALGQFRMDSNDLDRDGDGQTEPYPGNRTLDRNEFLTLWSVRNYTPIFRSQADHDHWYQQHIQRQPRVPVVGSLADALLFGSDDRWIANR